MRILHLAFEDHRRPGSGGGGIRTREIDRRLAARHDITVVTARYRGARRRVEDGVSYRPLGLNLGYLGSMATYHLALPFFLLFRRPDLVVEDFAAPTSSSLVPLWTTRPTIAVVQWLAADETSRRYHLPFWWFEEMGMRLQSRFVAVSGAIADRLLTANPRADVRVVYAGVDVPADIDTMLAEPRPTGSPPMVLYMGRLELQPKGLDLLLDVVKELADVDLRVVVAGDGPHRGQLESLIEACGLGHRVELAGRVDGRTKWQLLTEARVVAVPSRYESFGMVVAEATVAGTPVVAWDLPPFREILGPGMGRLVAPFDVSAFAAAVRAELGPPTGRPSRDVGAALAARRRFSWDEAATAHEAAYLLALTGGGGRRRSLRRFVDVLRQGRFARPGGGP